MGSVHVDLEQGDAGARIGKADLDGLVPYFRRDDRLAHVGGGGDPGIKYRQRHVGRTRRSDILPSHFDPFRIAKPGKLGLDIGDDPLRQGVDLGFVQRNWEAWRARIFNPELAGDLLFFRFDQRPDLAAVRLERILAVEHLDPILEPDLVVASVAALHYPDFPLAAPVQGRGKGRLVKIMLVIDLSFAGPNAFVDLTWIRCVQPPGNRFSPVSLYPRGVRVLPQRTPQSGNPHEWT